MITDLYRDYEDVSVKLKCHFQSAWLVTGQLLTGSEMFFLESVYFLSVCE